MTVLQVLLYKNNSTIGNYPAQNQHLNLSEMQITTAMIAGYINPVS